MHLLYFVRLLSSGMYKKYRSHHDNIVNRPCNRKYHHKDYDTNLKK